MYLRIYLSTYLSLYLPTHLPTYASTYLQLSTYVPLLLIYLSRKNVPIYKIQYASIRSPQNLQIVAIGLYLLLTSRRPCFSWSTGCGMPAPRNGVPSASIPTCCPGFPHLGWDNPLGPALQRITDPFSYQGTFFFKDDVIHFFPVWWDMLHSLKPRVSSVELQLFLP